ncbi:hypothetical protein ACPCUK_37370 [Streptomyces arboris]|uniref:hypothetical protein n=1 Tax=Streptomyces arboris TaxID=2600619 RepID=UPI003C2D4548
MSALTDAQQARVEPPIAVPDLLGYLFTSPIAVDPTSRKVHAFSERSSAYIPLHRDVECLVYALVEFRKLEVDHDNDVDPEELSVVVKSDFSSFVIARSWH